MVGWLKTTMTSVVINGSSGRLLGIGTVQIQVQVTWGAIHRPRSTFRSRAEWIPVQLPGNCFGPNARNAQNVELAVI